MKEVETQPTRERGDTERRKEQNTMQFPDANGRDEPATLTWKFITQVQMEEKGKMAGIRMTEAPQNSNRP